MNYIRNLLAARIGGASFGISGDIYKFERIKRAKREALEKNKGATLIDLGVGEPDEPADLSIVAVLAAEAGKPENRFYADNGIDELKAAASGYLEAVYGVTGVDPQTEIIHGIGSKPALALLPLCLIDPGDWGIVTVPGYPVAATYTRYAGGSVFELPLRKQNDFFPDFAEIPKNVLSKAKFIYLNYPNNPTAGVATREFFTRAVDFAGRHNISIIHNASYSAIVFDGAKPLSFLSVDGAKEIGVEIFSLSKAFNMTGWRIAFVAGNPLLVRAYGDVKDNTDSGQFRPIQKAAAFALAHPGITTGICEKYSRRFDLLVDARKPKGTFYCYVPIPVGTESGIRFENAGQVSDYLIREALVSTVPWDDAGAYLRLSVTFEARGLEEEKRIIAELSERLSKCRFVFS